MTYLGRLSGAGGGKSLRGIGNLGRLRRIGVGLEGHEAGSIDSVSSFLHFPHGEAGNIKIVGLFLLMIGIFFFSGGRYLGFAVVNEVSGVTYSSLFGAIFLVSALLILFFKR